MARWNDLLKKMISFALIRLFHCFPIQRNKVFLFSYYGSQYSCNPKYISAYLLNHFPKGTFDIVWAFNDVEAKRHVSGVRKVRTMSWAYFYEMCTAKIVITNCRTTESFVKRKHQYYIQTWHSSLRLKQIEKDAEDRLQPHYAEMARKDSAKCDLLLSGCEYSTHIFKRAFWYNGEIWQHGTPRNDILFHGSDRMRREILDRLGVHAGQRIVLYAPTFRKGNDTAANDHLHYASVMESLRRRFGGEWTFLVRLHPHLIAQADEWASSNSDYVVNATAYDDVQELLSAADVLVTDYSSLMFDFALTKRPCFLYTPDIEEYTRQDRQLYFSLDELPFTSANSHEELARVVETFDEAQYRRRLQLFLERIGSHEQGTACERLADRIAEICLSMRSVVYEKV